MIARKFSLLIFLIGFISCTSGQESNSTGYTTVQDLKKQIDKGDAITIVDIRTPQEVNTTGKVPGSVTIDFYDPAFDSKINELPKDKPVYVYCAAGGRSAKSLKKFEKSGFKETYSVNGGMGAWQSNNYPTEK